MRTPRKRSAPVRTCRVLFPAFPNLGHFSAQTVEVGKITNSVTPQSLSSALIVEIALASIVMIFIGESGFSYSRESQDGSVPNTINRLRWAATRRVDMGKLQKERRVRRVQVVFGVFFIARQVEPFPFVLCKLFR